MVEAGVALAPLLAFLFFVDLSVCCRVFTWERERGGGGLFPKLEEDITVRFVEG
jgi:hypothetical protein